MFTVTTARGDDNDMPLGQGSHDVLNGDAGDNELRGGNGIDTLDGGAGNDTHSGAQGNDLFVFEDGADWIRTFGDNRDTLQLDDASWSSAGTLTVNGVLNMFAMQLSDNRVVLDFDGVNSVTLVNGAGLTEAQHANDIDIV